VYPISRTLPRFNDPQGANHFTSACSPMIYRDNLFGEAFYGNAFISEPVHNLIHREVMSAKGVTFTSRRAEDERESEFLASSDNWFRPTMIQTGPDGGLWIADMYRQVIEHPEWIPKDWQKKLDLRAGADKGRIYRVVPVGAKPRAIPRLDKLDTAGLVAALDSPNGWQRDTAQMMLLWRNDKAAVPLLEKMATENMNPLARLHALCTLDGLVDEVRNPKLVRALGVGTPTLVEALGDAHPGVRRHAVHLCERHLTTSPKLGSALKNTVDDPDPQVRLQLAYTLGTWIDAGSREELGQIALRSGNDPYILAAAMSSMKKDNLDLVLKTILNGTENVSPPEQIIQMLLRYSSAVGDSSTLVILIDRLATPEKGRFAAWQYRTLAAALDAEGNPDERWKEQLERLGKLFAAARQVAADDKTPLPERSAAIGVLGRGPDHRDDDIKTLAGFLTPQAPPELQTAAVATLGRVQQANVPELLLHNWKGFGPALRAQILDELLRRQGWMEAIFDAIDRKDILPIEIDAARRQRLLQQKDATLRKRAEKLFAGYINPDRQKVIDSYRSVLTTKGDPKRGAQVFTKICASCHRFQGVGEEVGPDLASLGDKSPEALLVAILDPNRAVEARYIAYIAATKSGVSYTGLLASETGNSVTLVSQDGKKHTILRTDLEALSSTDKSAMPEGLEKDLKPQDIADVIAHLRVGVPAPVRKTFEGNKPEVVHADKDGSLHLSATTCEIYGSTLGFDPLRVKLTDWNTEDDRAVWTIELPRAGKYTVSLEYACSDDSAGNKIQLESGGRHLTGTVAGTGGGHAFKQVKVGDIELAAGKQQVTLRSAGKIREYLLELKAMRLVPIAAK
jgi:putative heme-binding domain-containing protein